MHGPSGRVEASELRAAEAKAEEDARIVREMEEDAKRVAKKKEEQEKTTTTMITTMMITTMMKTMVIRLMKLLAKIPT